MGAKTDLGEDTASGTFASLPSHSPTILKSGASSTDWHSKNTGSAYFASKSSTPDELLLRREAWKWGSLRPLNEHGTVEGGLWWGAGRTMSDIDDSRPERQSRYSSVPPDEAVQSSSMSDRTRPGSACDKTSDRRNVTAQACLRCKASHLRCEGDKPCSRCVAAGLGHTCSLAPHKRRGRPKKTRSTADHQSAGNRSILPDRDRDDRLQPSDPVIPSSSHFAYSGPNSFLISGRNTSTRSTARLFTEPVHTAARYNPPIVSPTIAPQGILHAPSDRKYFDAYALRRQR